MNKIIIDLKNCQNTKQVLMKIGEAFQFGGTKENRSSPLDSNTGWGLNWNALFDSLIYLESGGIWGTSPKINFPIIVKIINSSLYKKSDIEGFNILIQILNDTKSRYLEENKQFDFITDDESSNSYG